MRDSQKGGGCASGSERALTVVLQHEVHICDGAQPQRILAVADAVDVLRDLLHPFVQPDGLAQLLFLANVPDIESNVAGWIMSWQQTKQSLEALEALNAHCCLWQLLVPMIALTQLVLLHMDI